MTDYFTVKCGLEFDERDLFECTYVDLFGGTVSVIKSLRHGEEYKFSEPEKINSCYAIWKRARQ